MELTWLERYALMPMLFFRALQLNKNIKAAIAGVKRALPVMWGYMEAKKYWMQNDR